MGEQNYINIERIEKCIAKINIQKKTAMNAMNSKMVNELKNAIKHLEEDNDIVCVIIAGEKEYFIAGADIREMKGASVSEAHNFSKRMKALHDLIIHSKKPYIAAIRGYCLGGGLELGLACDIRLADNTVKLGLPEINLGIIPGGGGIFRIADLAGTSFTSQLVMTGEMIDAEQAYKAQLVNSVTENVIEEAISIARSISTKSRPAIIALKRLLTQRKLRKNISELEEEMYEFSLLFDQPDAFEGISAFIEKRKPEFQ